MVRQNVKALVGRDSCGALSDASAIVGITRIHSIAGTPVEGSTSLVLGGYAKPPGLTDGPMDAVPVWGTAFKQGTLVTPDFEVGTTRRLAVWTAVGPGNGIATQAIFGGDGIAPTAVDLPSDPGRAMWHLHLLNVPEGADFVTFQIQAFVGGLLGWGAVSSPVVPMLEPAANVLRHGSSFMGPSEKTRYPCAHLPAPVDGYWPPFEYLVDEPSALWSPDRYTVGLTRTEIGCDAGSSSCLSQLDYESANVSITRE
jgi:hypothetical protein